MPGDVFCHQRSAELLRVEGRDLLVDRADARALLVVEHRAGDRAGNVVLGELGGRARVDDGVERAKGGGFGRQAQARFVMRVLHGWILRTARPSAARSAAGENSPRRAAKARLSMGRKFSSSMLLPISLLSAFSSNSGKYP